MIFRKSLKIRVQNLHQEIDPCQRCLPLNDPWYNWVVCNTASWRFQPIWKICSSNWIISPRKGENKNYFKPPPKKKNLTHRINGTYTLTYPCSIQDLCPSESGTTKKRQCHGSWPPYEAPRNWASGSVLLGSVRFFVGRILGILKNPWKLYPVLVIGRDYRTFKA